MQETPTVQQLLAGLQRFNEWERAEEREVLARLTVEESLRQYFELCEMARRLAPGSEQVFLEEDAARWRAMHREMVKAAKVMGRARTSRRD